MKLVTFKVAKVLKDAGYPQELNDKNEYYSTNIDKDNPDCEITDEPFTPYRFETSVYEYYVAPTYLEVWLWLWQIKNIYITFSNFGSGAVAYCTNGKSIFKYSGNNPEEVIEKAVEYLCENGLIK